MSLTVQARIIDSVSKKPMPMVNIFVSDAQGNQVTHNGVPNVGRTSDNNGNFIIPVAFDDDFITLSFVGYQTLTLPAESAANKTQFIMRSKVQDLQEAVVTGTRPSYLPRTAPPRAIPRTTPIKTASMPKKKNTWLIVGAAIAGVAVLGTIIYLIVKK